VDTSYFDSEITTQYIDHRVLGTEHREHEDKYKYRNFKFNKKLASGHWSKLFNLT